MKLFISLESYWNVDVQNVFAWPIWTSTTQVMAKRKATTESWESTRLLSVQVACDTPLERSRQGLQLWFRPHPDQRSAQEATILQSCGIPNLDDFGTPKWESRDKSHSDTTLARRCKVYYVGEGGGFPRVWAMVILWVRGHSWLVLTPKVLQPCANQLVCWFCAGLLDWVNCLSLFLVPFRSSRTPLYPSNPSKVLRVREHALNPNLSVVSIFKFSLSLPRGLGPRHNHQ